MNTIERIVGMRWAPYLRYGFAILGPVGSAGAQFILTLELLHAVPNATFGSFSFLMVTSALATGVASALFCAPLPKLLADADEVERGAILDCLFAVNLADACLAFFLFCALGSWLNLTLAETLLFAAFAALMQIRWFARAHAYATGMQWRTVSSDVVYGLVLLCVCALMVPFKAVSLAFASFGMALAVLFSLPMFGGAYLGRQFLQLRPAALSRYGAIWRAHSSWSLIGVITTEATANAHAYIVTAFSGPSEFARIAASALLIRPIAIAMNAFTEYERPRLARALGGMTPDGVTGAVRFFRFALAAIWAVTALVSLALTVLAPRLMFPARYSASDMITGCILWLAIAGVRLMRTPESTLLQAAGRFRPLALASVASCGFSVAAVVVLLVLGGPLWSVAGILLGEMIFAALIWKSAAALKA